MKKFAKMSLVAAVAVAGFTSYSSASSLEEAVKNTDISGYLRYRIETDYKNSSETSTRLKYVFKTKTKVNDYITANTKFTDEQYNDSLTAKMTFGYFTYANQGLAVSVGRQGLVSPLTDNGNAGDGIVATYNFGNVTLAGAYYTSLGSNSYETSKAVSTDNTNLNQLQGTSSGIDHYGVGVIASFDPVNFQLWYLTTADEINDENTNYSDDLVNVDGADAWAFQVDAKVGPVGLYGFYSALELGHDNDQVVDGTTYELDDISFLNLQVSGDIGPVSLSLDYVRTGDDSGNTTLDGDSDAMANTGLTVVDTYNYSDGDFFIAKISGNVSDSLNLELAHLNGEGNANYAGGHSDKDVDETRLKATYTMSKNFTVTGSYSFGEDEAGVSSVDSDSDFDFSRIELKYTF